MILVRNLPELTNKIDSLAVLKKNRVCAKRQFALENYDHPMQKRTHLLKSKSRHTSFLHQNKKTKKDHLT